MSDRLSPDEHRLWMTAVSAAVSKTLKLPSNIELERRARSVHGAKKSLECNQRSRSDLIACRYSEIFN